jgi:uracil phosphoribosyltransferase
LTCHFESQLHKRKQCSTGDAMRSHRFVLTQEEREAERCSIPPSASSSQGGDDTPAEGLSPTTPRPRTSRYLSEGARKEIIARIDAGEKQVALAKEFKVSRAAICNLYKNRWEVLTRGVRDPTATHPKKSRKKISPHHKAPAAATPPPSMVAAMLSPSCPGVSRISIQANASASLDRADTPPPLPPRQDATQRVDFLSFPRTPVDQQQDPPRHRNILQDEVSPRDRRTHADVGVGNPRRFLVHEASAYSYPCRNLVATLRDERIGTAVFQQRATRLARLLVEEVLTCLPHDEEEVTNMHGDLCHTMKALDGGDFCAVSMEDKGMVLMRAFSDISPTSPTGVVSMEQRAAEDRGSTVPPPRIYSQLPPINATQFVLLLDIECAAGEKACAVLHHLTHDRQIPAENIYFVTVISAFEGLQNVFQHFPGESSASSPTWYEPPELTHIAACCLSARYRRLARHRTGRHRAGRPAAHPPRHRRLRAALLERQRQGARRKFKTTVVIKTI